LEAELRIALDYDLTYSADEVLWHKFLNLAQTRGHEVRIVTIRDERHDRTAALIALEKHVPVIYTRGVAKAFYVMHFVPDFWPVSIWIDDKPETITHNSETTPEALAVWRAERGEPA
jgi:hypothetical protein